MKHIKKIFRNVLGSLFILIGVISLFLIPILPQLPFFLLGFILLDFKKKEEYEHKILTFISKSKFGKKMVDKWIAYKQKKNKKKDDIVN